MRTAAASQDGVTGFDRKWLAVDRHDTVAAREVVNLVGLLQVIPDGRAFVEHALAKRKLQVRRLFKKR